MGNAELTALVDLNLAASNLRIVAETLITEPEGIRTAEALLFIARGLTRIHEDLRLVVVADATRRGAQPPAVVVPLRPVAEAHEHV
jgi:hypothetical protein